MLDVIVSVKLISMLAKDMHYRSNDEWFYALHLLADKVDFKDDIDDLKEGYYLGFKAEVPPSEKVIAEQAAQRAPDTTNATNEELIRHLMDACENGIYSIEEAKREPGLVAGVHAIVDGISQKMLTIKGLCWRSLNDGSGEGN